MRHKGFFILLLLFAFFLAGGAFHHHADGQIHGDCLRCVLGAQSSWYLAPVCEPLAPLFFPLLWEFSGYFLTISFAALESPSVRAPPHLFPPLS